LHGKKKSRPRLHPKGRRSWATLRRAGIALKMKAPSGKKPKGRGEVHYCNEVGMGVEDLKKGCVAWKKKWGARMSYPPTCRGRRGGREKRKKAVGDAKRGGGVDRGDTPPSYTAPLETMTKKQNEAQGSRVDASHNTGRGKFEWKFSGVFLG